jgi:PAS domain S-box-containing protein
MSATILVIDDSADDQLLYQRAFKDFECHFNLVMASSAQDGFARIAEARPDLILLDYNLPNMDGLGFMKRLSEFADTPIPIVMLTGEGSAAVAVEVMKHGADDYLVKDSGGKYLRLLPKIAGRVLADHAQRELTRRLQRKTEALLRRNHALMHNSMDGIHVMDMSGNLVEANDAFCKMLGYTREEAERLNVADWDAQMSPEELRERFKELVGKSARFETVHRRKDGTLIDVEVSSSGIEIEEQYFMFASSRDITERKKAEAVLRQHALVIDTSIDGFWATDMRGYVLEANAAYAKMSGYTVEELAGMHISQLEAIELKPEDVHVHIAKVVAQGYDRFETRHRHKDGHEIDIEVSVNYMAEPGRLFVFSRDITERTSRNKAINQARMELQDLYDQAPCGYHSLDSDGRIVKINKTEADWLGYECAELIGREIKEFQTPSSLLAFAKNYPVFKEKGYIENVEYELVRKDGSTFFVLLSATMVKDADGNSIMSRSTMIDVTERKRAEAALLQGEANLRAILDNSPYMTWLKDAKGRYISINKVFADYLRLEDAGQAAGKTDLDLQPEELAKKYRADDAEVMAARQRKTVEESAFDGKNTHWVETSKTPIIDKKGKVLGTVGFARDITERKLAEERLLRESEHEHKRAEILAQQFGHLLRSSFNEIYLFDADSLRFLQVSEGAKGRSTTWAIPTSNCNSSRRST